MGSLFGGLLAAAGEDVTLLTRNATHVDAIQEQGLRIVDEQPDSSTDQIVSVRVTTDQATVGVSTHGAIHDAPGTVSHTGTGNTALGWWQDDDSAVDFELRPGSDPAVDDERATEITVADDGPGIPEQERGPIRRGRGH